MKKIIYFIMLFAMCIQPAILLAQDEEDEKMYKGIKFGYQNSQLSKSDWGELSSFYAGFFDRLPEGSGPMFSRSGWSRPTFTCWFACIQP